VPFSLHPLPVIARITRWLQSLRPRRPLKGATRLANWLHRFLPPYQGVVRLEGGMRMAVDTRFSAERTILLFGSYQPALARLLREHTPPDGHCLDIGANVGFFTLQFAQQVGRAGRVAAFEANPALAERIRDNAALNDFSHVHVVNKAVDRQAGQAAFYISPQPGKSSLLGEHVASPTQTIVVETIIIDAYLEQHDWPRLDIIKMDIEGNDCSALLGARESLTRFRPFIVLEYWYNTPTAIAREAFALLDDLGYALEGLESSGRRTLFTWRGPHPTGQKHIDVICLPR